MNVTREVILDLLPVYLSGESSPATRALVEEYLKEDTELGQRIRLQWAENLARAVPSTLPPELELRALRRTRKLLALQRWLFGFGIFFSAVSLSLELSIDDGHLKTLRPLMFDYPAELGLCLAVGFLCWIIYFSIRRHLRTTGL